MGWLCIQSKDGDRRPAMVTGTMVTETMGIGDGHRLRGWSLRGTFSPTLETPRVAFLAFHRLRTYRIPTKLAHLSVIGVRPAIAHSDFGPVFVDASLVGSG